MNSLVNLGERIIQLEKERDELKRKLDDVVELFNTHLYHRVQQRLNKIMEDE